MEQVARRWRLGMSGRILLGLGLGITAGLFFGVRMDFLKVPGDMFVGLTEVTVIPFILVGLVRGIGGLDAASAKRMATRGLPVLLVFWVVTIAVLYVMPLAFPPRVNDSFYDPNRIATGADPEAIDWVSFVPANPFASLAQGVVPAVVAFAIFLGIALIGMRHKQRVLDGLGFADDLLGRISHAIVAYGSPFGVFAIAASTVGTADLRALRDLSVFLATNIVAVLVYSLVILPLGVSAFTGISVGRLIRAYKAPALLALSTGNTFITLPLVADATRELLVEGGAEDEHAADVADTLVPFGFVLPLFAGMSALLFVEFVAWFEGIALRAGQLFSLAVVGIMTLFAGEPSFTIPHLLNTMGLPKEATSLYLAADSVLAYPREFAGTISVAGLAVAGGAAVLGINRRWSTRALRPLAVSAGVLAVAVLVTQVALRPLATTQSEGYETLQQMRVNWSVPVGVHRSIDDAPPPRQVSAGVTLLDDIRQSKVLRVGYIPDAFPFSYFNGSDDLVGYDIERMYYFAAALEADRIEFIPVPRQEFAPLLDSGMVDIVAGAPYLTPSLYQEVDFTDVYLTLHVAVVAPDSEADLYRTEESFANMDGKRIAVQRGSYYVEAIRAGNSNLEVVEIDGPLAFFESDVADALFSSAEEGSALTIMHPQYEVVVPEFPQPPIYLAYPVPKGQIEWILFLNNWLTTIEQSDLAQAQYDYWITGRTAGTQASRWSIARDVLHWEI